MTSLTKLLPCPFCGDAPVWETDDGRDDFICHVARIECRNRLCPVTPSATGTTTGNEKALDRAASYWNTRTRHVSDELDAATALKCAEICENLRHKDYSSESEDWIAGTRDCASAIRSLIPNSAGDARTTHLQGEGEPVVKQVPSPAETVSALNSQYAGLDALLAAIHAADPKRELLVRVGDLMRENRALLSQFDVRRK